MKTSDLEVYLNKIEKSNNNSQKLADQSQEFSLFIQEKMEDQGIGELLGGKYSLRTIKSSAGSDTSLYLYVSTSYCEYQVCLDTNNLSSTNETRYLYGDFNASYIIPSLRDVLTFLNDAEGLLKELGSISDKLTFPKTV